MRTIPEIKSKETIRPLSGDEIAVVSGGLFGTVGGMPDRSVQCGTMWWMDQWLKKFFPQR